MDLRQVRQFVKLCELGNFHRAAEALNISQPPLSLSMRKLEQELGVRLFERHARGVTPTEAAVAALPLAREALEAIEALAQAVRQTGEGARGRLRLGFVGSVTHDLLPRIVLQFRAARPGVDLSLTEATSLDVMKGVEEGSLDAGLLRTPLAQASRLRFTTLVEEPLVALLPRSHRLVRSGALRLEELNGEPFIAYDPVRAPNLSTLVLMACGAAGFAPVVAEESASIHTIVALVESGLGVALAPLVVGRAAAARVAAVPLTAAGRPVLVGLSLATRPADRRLSVQGFADVARAAVGAPAVPVSAARQSILAQATATPHA